MFTDKDAWNGGDYELCIEVGKNNVKVLDRIIKCLWDVAPMMGCYPSNKREPEEQKAISPNLENCTKHHFENAFLQVAEHLFESVKFQGALVGYMVEAVFDHDFLYKGIIPESRYASYLVNNQGKLETYKINKWD